MRQWRKVKATPPPVVFQVESDVMEDWYLVDGFHRFFAHEAAERDTIDVILHKGKTYDEALTYAMSSNFTNGLRPAKKDAAKCIKVLCDHASEDFGFNSKRVVTYLVGLGIPKRTAGLHTVELREAIDAKRDEKIKEMDSEGQTQREIAEAVGCDHKTVGSRLKALKASGENAPMAETPQDAPGIEDDDDLLLDEPTPEELGPKLNPADAMNKEIARVDADRKDGCRKRPVAEKCTPHTAATKDIDDNDLLLNDPATEELEPAVNPIDAMNKEIARTDENMKVTPDGTNCLPTP